MAPGMFANELPQLLVVLQFYSGYLFGKNEVGALQFIGHPPNMANALDYGGEIVSPLIGPFLEIVKIDHRRIPRIARLQRYGSTAVVGMRFQQREGEMVATVSDRF